MLRFRYSFPVENLYFQRLQVFRLLRKGNTIWLLVGKSQAYYLFIMWLLEVSRHFQDRVPLHLIVSIFLEGSGHLLRYLRNLQLNFSFWSTIFPVFSAGVSIHYATATKISASDTKRTFIASNRFVLPFSNLPYNVVTLAFLWVSVKGSKLDG